MELVELGCWWRARLDFKKGDKSIGAQHQYSRTVGRVKWQMIREYRKIRTGPTASGPGLPFRDGPDPLETRKRGWAGVSDCDESWYGP